MNGVLGVCLLLLGQAATPAYVSEAKKAAGPEGVMVIIREAPGSAPEKWPITSGLRNRIARELGDAGLKAVTSAAAEQRVGGKSGVIKPRDAAVLQRSEPFSLLLSGSYMHRGSTRTVSFMLIDPKTQRAVWKGSAKIAPDELDSIYAMRPTSERLLSYVYDNSGKQVGNGERWTLADEGLKSASSGWSKLEELFTATGGAGLAPDAPAVAPGDVIQFEGVSIVCNGSTLTMPHHYAVISKVDSPTSFEVMHQNYNGAKTVTSTWLDLTGLKTGTMKFSRPK